MRGRKHKIRALAIPTTHTCQLEKIFGYRTFNSIDEAGTPYTMENRHVARKARRGIIVGTEKSDTIDSIVVITSWWFVLSVFGSITALVDATIHGRLFAIDYLTVSWVMFPVFRNFRTSMVARLHVKRNQDRDGKAFDLLRCNVWWAFQEEIQDKELLNTKPESENALMQVQCSWIVQLTGSANWTLSRCEQWYPRPTKNSDWWTTYAMHE